VATMPGERPQDMPPDACPYFLCVLFAGTASLPQARQALLHDNASTRSFMLQQSIF